jgi:hypothetical protein
MSPLVKRGLWVAVMHVALVASLGAKFTYDRATRPRVWARAAPVDPNLPIRGRYVQLRLEATIGEGLVLAPGRAQVQPSANPNGRIWTPVAPATDVALRVLNGELVAVPAPPAGGLLARLAQRDGRRVAVLDQPLAYFIPEHVADPSRRSAGEELWVEVTIPPSGAPRPIRLGVMKDGVLSALDLR